MLATVTFDVSDIQSKHNLKLTIPADVQLNFRESILHYAGKCTKEIDYYLTKFG